MINNSIMYGKLKRLSEEDKITLQAWWVMHPYATQDEIRSYILKRFGFSVGNVLICKLRKELNIGTKPKIGQRKLK